MALFVLIHRTTANDVVQNQHVVAGASNQNEHMPNRMEVWSFVVRQEPSSARIRSRSGQNPGAASNSKAVKELRNRQDRNPTDEQIEPHAHVVVLRKKELRNNSSQSHNPHGSEQDSPPSIIQVGHSKRCETPRNKQKNADLIERPKAMPPDSTMHAV